MPSMNVPEKLDPYVALGETVTLHTFSNGTTTWAYGIEAGGTLHHELDWIYGNRSLTLTIAALMIIVDVISVVLLLPGHPIVGLLIIIPLAFISVFPIGAAFFVMRTPSREQLLASMGCTEAAAT